MECFTIFIPCKTTRVTSSTILRVCFSVYVFEHINVGSKKAPAYLKFPNVLPILSSNSILNYLHPMKRKQDGERRQEKEEKMASLGNVSLFLLHLLPSLWKASDDQLSMHKTQKIQNFLATSEHKSTRSSGLPT